MEIAQFIVKKSVDWTLPLTLSLHFTLNLQSALCSIQSAFYTDCKVLQLMNYVMYIVSTVDYDPSYAKLKASSSAKFNY